MRRWAERIVIVIAALASIATPQKKWFVEATLPSSTLPTPGKATIVTIEASQAPEVWIDGEYVPSIDNATTKWRYLVPAGASLSRVVIAGGCGSQLCGGSCTAPGNAYVRVASAAPAEAWIAEDRSTPVTTVLDPAKPDPSYRVMIEATRSPIALEIDVAPSTIAPTIRSGESGPTSTFHVYWHAQAAPATVTWTAHATIQGICPGTAGCSIPAAETVRVVSVAREHDAP